MKSIFFNIVLLIYSGTQLPVYASSNNINPGVIDTSIVIPIDSIGITKDNLPLSESIKGLSRPAFETSYLMIGIGVGRSDFRGLEPIVTTNSVSMPLLCNIYIYFPLQGVESSFFFISGWDIALRKVAGGSLLSFKALILYREHRTPFIKPFLGLGGGGTFYSYDGDVKIEASRAYPIIAIGANLKPRQIDVLLTVPLAAGLSTEFEGRQYSIRPAGIQLSLLFSFDY